MFKLRSTILYYSTCSMFHNMHSTVTCDWRLQPYILSDFFLNLRLYIFKPCKSAWQYSIHVYTMWQNSGCGALVVYRYCVFICWYFCFSLSMSWVQTSLCDGGWNIWDQNFWRFVSVIYRPFNGTFVSTLLWMLQQSDSSVSPEEY